MNVNYSDLENKIILITGATRGIGKGIAMQLASNKAHVVFNYRGEDKKAIDLKEELIKAGASKVSAVKFDMTDYESMKSELDAFIKENGAISGLINNAGISKDQLAMRVKEDDITSLLDVILRAQ
jgi:3-oxoacyl-[acyl-carrier protein] reductase